MVFHTSFLVSSGNLGDILIHKKKQFRNLNRRFVNIWAEKIGRVEKISPLLRLERFEVKQVVFGRTQAFVKVLFVIEQEF